MADPQLQWKLDELAHDLDMLVYRLEGEPPNDPEALRRDLQETRRALERFRDRLRDLGRS